MADHRRSYWGWGVEDQMPGEAEVRALLRRVGPLLGPRAGKLGLRQPVPLEQVSLPAPRVAPPAALAPLCTDAPRERALHSHGRNYADVFRGFSGDFAHPPDWVAHPHDEADVVRLLDWCGSHNIAVVPFGGGSSVVGGVEPDVGPGFAATLSLDLGRLDRVLEVDHQSRAARIQAGVLGPALEQQLRPHELTLRHFPQSFEFSSLGGWIATRAGGHFATLYTHIDDFVESLRLVTPRGVLSSRRLPGSGAGPSPDRLFIGSEGALGVITEAWMRLQPRPRHRARAAVRFRGFFDGVEACREIAQSGSYPANCRLLDTAEAFNSGAARDGSSVLLLAFESASRPVERDLEHTLELCRAHGGQVDRPEAAAGQQGQAPDASGEWRAAFLRAPYLLNAAVCAGLMVDTFETAITWERFAALHEQVIAEMMRALTELCGGGLVMCRFTHLYPDGPAPYFTFATAAPAGGELACWRTLRKVAADAVLAAGGTITHHHSVGRLHRPWYERQRPQLFGDALAAAKRALDPGGILNPGALLPAQR